LTGVAVAVPVGVLDGDEEGRSSISFVAADTVAAGPSLFDDISMLN
jgi:hypothetical protein